MKFKDKIKKLRLDNNLTQEDLAKICFVSRNAVSKWERDEGYPNIESLKLISKHFNVSIDNLLNEEDLINLSLKNNEERKNIYQRIIIFIIYIIIGILIPILCFKIDPTSVMAYCIFIGPLTYLLYGVILGLLYHKNKDVIIIGLIGILPILFYFETTNVNLVFISFVFYLIFILFYLLTYFIKKKILTNKKQN